MTAAGRSRSPSRGVPPGATVIKMPRPTDFTAAHGIMPQFDFGCHLNSCGEYLRLRQEPTFLEAFMKV